jgi:nicotinate-nucleotide pyrophosphorylase (carboxylating)
MMAAFDLRTLEPRLRAALAEDLGPGDVTSRLLVPAEARAVARITAKAAGVVSCADVAAEVLRLAGADDVLGVVPEGTVVAPGDALLSASGSARSLLAGERTALNLLIRLCGVATRTAAFVRAVAGTGARILDTRKTTPLWRDLEKRAVLAGGGDNHRFALYDAVLVKENHLVFGADLRAALASRPAGMAAIVEAESIEEFEAARDAGADVVMLDEFTPERVADVVRLRGPAARPLLEVSGGITLDNVRAYAEAGADRISIGGITHSAPALDLSLRLDAAGP